MTKDASDSGLWIMPAPPKPPAKSAGVGERVVGGSVRFDEGRGRKSGDDLARRQCADLRLSRLRRSDLDPTVADAGRLLALRHERRVDGRAAAAGSGIARQGKAAAG